MVAEDMLLLALKAYRHGEVSASARLFVAAASASDSRSFESHLASLAECAEDEICQVELSEDEEAASAFSLALSLAEETKDDRDALMAAIKFVKEQASDVDDDETIDISDEDEPEEEVVNDSDEDVPEFDSIVETDEVELSSDVMGIIRSRLKVMKARSADWEVRREIPILVSIFPNLFSGDAASLPTEFDEPGVRSVINSMLNKLKSLSAQQIVALAKATKKFEV
jgi:hypothetical protein